MSPFSRVIQGREYVFAHNGGLRDFKDALSLEPYSCLGKTTSEHAFCHLLTSAEKAIRGDRWKEVLQVLRRINEFGHFNCVFSDGVVLAAYRDRAGYKNLCVLERHAPFGQICLDGDDAFRVDLRLSEDDSRRACLFATRPLTHGEDWRRLPAGGVAISRDGEILDILE